MDHYYWAALKLVSGLGNSRIQSLVFRFGSAQKAWLADRRDLFLCNFMDVATCNNLLAGREKIDVQKLALAWQRQNIRVVAITDPQYPALLRTIFDPPAVLFYRGQLPDHDNIIAIVGARRASSYGKNAATRLAADLAAAGFIVVSGAARGIDTAAHVGALECGSTIAILGSGVDVAYPAENASLLAKIAERGAVISEYPPGTAPFPAQFPARNRIISGLAKGVVVVEAAQKSGSLITADFALETGRDVFAIPGSIFSANSRGTHQLIKQGAKLVDTVEDILEEYGLIAAKPISRIQLSEAEALIYSAMTYDNDITVEELVQKTGLAVNNISSILVQLELRDLVSSCGGQRYVRKAGREVF